MNPELETYFFPIVNEQGFKVVDLPSYQHMINTIVEAQIELVEDYPGHNIVVYYELCDD